MDNGETPVGMEVKACFRAWRLGLRSQFWDATLVLGLVGGIYVLTLPSVTNAPTLTARILQAHHDVAGGTPLHPSSLRRSCQLRTSTSIPILC